MLLPRKVAEGFAALGVLMASPASAQEVPRPPLSQQIECAKIAITGGKDDSAVIQTELPNGITALTFTRQTESPRGQFNIVTTTIKLNPDWTIDPDGVGIIDVGASVRTNEGQANQMNVSLSFLRVIYPNNGQPQEGYKIYYDTGQAQYKNRRVADEVFKPLSEIAYAIRKGQLACHVMFNIKRGYNPYNLEVTPVTPRRTP